MLEIDHCLQIRSNINEIKNLQTDTIAIATELHGAKFFTYDECKTGTSISHEYLNHETASTSFSYNGEFLAFAKDSKIFILHIPSQIVLKKINADREKIEHIEFDLESKYIIAATASGRVLQYRYDGSSLLARLYSFGQTTITSNKEFSTVSSFAFEKNIMACGGNNGVIFSINLHSRANKILIENTKDRITSLCFLDSDTIISADDKGMLYFNSVKNQNLIKKIETPFRKITKILLMPNPKYLMILGEEKYITVYHTETFKLVHKTYVEFDTIITDILIVNNTSMLAVLENKIVKKITLLNVDKLKSYIVHNNLDKAYALVKRDPLLLETKEYTALEKAYNNVYKKALEELKKHNPRVALQLTSIFKYVDAKKDEIELLFKSFDNYARFNALCQEKKYALAYGMANKFPPLMQTFQYSKLEEAWKSAFQNAQRQIAYGKNENALALLNEFATVREKRPIIKLVLNHNEDFTKFLKALESQNFQQISLLAKKNELFTLIPTYKNIDAAMQKALEGVQKDINACKLDSALKKLSKLQNITSIEEVVSVQKEECRAVKSLKTAYKNNEFTKCYEIIDNNPSLNTTQLGILLQEHWYKVSSKSESYALKGNIKGIKETLGELIDLSTRRDKIGDLFRLSFHTQIKGLVAKKLYRKAESLLYSYIDIFGLDKEMLSIMRMYEFRAKNKLAITQDQSVRQKRDKWVSSELIMGNSSEK